MTSYDDLENRLTTLENLINSGTQIISAPLKEPEKNDFVYIQNGLGNYRVGLKNLINTAYVLPASEALNAGDMVNIWSDAGIAKVQKADAGTNKQADAFVLTVAVIGTNVQIYFVGINDQLSLLTPGSKYFLSETPGGITTTPPTSGAGKISQYVGKSTSLNEIAFQPFAPVELL